MGDSIVVKLSGLCQVRPFVPPLVNLHVFQAPMVLGSRLRFKDLALWIGHGRRTLMLILIRRACMHAGCIFSQGDICMCVHGS
jgi:hypothetical protein